MNNLDLVLMAFVITLLGLSYLTNSIEHHETHAQLDRIEALLFCPESGLVYCDGIVCDCTDGKQSARLWEAR